MDYMKISQNKLLRRIPDVCFLNFIYLLKTGKKLDLKDPKTFNEKMQWLKIYNRRDIYTTLVDKVKVKDYISKKYNLNIFPKTYAVWDTVDEIDMDILPNRFVLKTNNDSGGVCICKDKNSFDLNSAKVLLASHLKNNYYWAWREWPYKNIEKKVFAEEYIEHKDDLLDYKLFVFNNGRIVTLVCSNRFSDGGLRETFFDEKWNKLDLEEGNHGTEENIDVPVHFEEMKKYARLISNGSPFMRVDFYDTNGKLYLGEITFYPNGGFEKFNPEDWDMILGSWISLD